MGSRRVAYQLGVDSALEAAEFGDFTKEELAERENFELAILEICENKRQYAGHPGYDFNGSGDHEALWNAFDRGELAGARKASIRAARKRCLK